MKSKDTVRKILILSLSLCVLVIYPQVAGSPRWITMGSLFFYYMILASSWNLLLGYTGIFSFGHMASVLLGGYSAGLMTLKAGINPIFAFLIGGLVAAFVNLLVGILCLRLRGFYLTLVTWAFSEMTIAVMNNEYGVTGGSMGLMVKGIFSSTSGLVENYYLGLVLAAVFSILMYFLIHSRAGIYLRSIRDDEAASEVMGVNSTAWKVFSFTFSGFWAGLAGSYYINFMGIIDPTVGNLGQLGNVMLMVVLGGLGTLTGPVIGALLVVLASQLLIGFESMSMLIFAILMIITLRYFPGGIMGGLQKVREALRRRGFPHDRPDTKIQ